MPAERDFYLRRAIFGGFAVLAPEQMAVDVERRVRAAFDADPRPKLSPQERDTRLSELRARLRKVEALRELALRKQEEDTGQLVADARRDGELFLLSDTDLRKEATA